MMVISAGTRYDFALDLGLDRDDPASCLNALTDGTELRIDLGLIGKPDVRQQRLVRRLRRGRAEPRLPRRQVRHHAFRCSLTC